MTTKADVFAQIETARNTALAVLEAVRDKRDWMFLTPALWPQIPGADGYVENAAQNVATIELLPEILEDALVSQDVATALGQAMVIVEQTGESSTRYATWAKAWSLVTLGKDVWSALKGEDGRLHAHHASGRGPEARRLRPLRRWQGRRGVSHR